MKNKYTILGIVFAAVTITGWLAALWYLPREFGMPDKAGEFGDMFGALNALFSGFAFAALILTIIVQMDQLTHARLESKRQQVDATFFRLLDYYRKNLEAIIITQKLGDGSSKKIAGIEALAFLLDKFGEEWRKRPKNFAGDAEYEVLETRHYFESKIRQVLVRQARYLETLQALLEYVDDEVDEEDEKDRYFSIAASQLTSFELRYIFYHSIVSTDVDGFRDIILRSGIVQKRISVINISNICLKLASEQFGMPLEKYKKPQAGYLKDLRRLRRRARKAAGRAAALTRLEDSGISEA